MSYKLGIDLGSISLKAVLLTQDGEVVFSRWTRVAGEPLQELAKVLSCVADAHPCAAIDGVGATGSGRTLVARVLEAHTVNEISAHAAAARLAMPQVATIIEIGGQDSKLMILDPSGTSHVVRDFRMNELCAAGTGAFLDQQAARLEMPIESFAALARDATDPVPIAGRCAVFAKTDMTHHQQEGRVLADIVAGLNEALVRSYLANLVRGRELPRPIAFQGGVAANEGLVAAFRRILKLAPEDLIVPEHHKVMGAIGAAHVAGEGRPRALTAIVEDVRRRCEDHVGCLLAHEQRSAKLDRPRGNALAPSYGAMPDEGTYLGIDVGSVSVKIVVMSGQGVLYSDYRFSDGRPLDALGAMIERVPERIGADITGIGVTGSGRQVVATLMDADIAINEITAQVRAVDMLFPEVDTIVEIGGQDAKFIRVSDGVASYFSMNKVCAAGTGAFLQEQAKRLHIDLEGQFARMAFDSAMPVALGARCTVFMESDLVSHQQQGYAKADLVAGLARSVVANYRERVIAGHPLGTRALFLGGVAKNEAVVAAMQDELGVPLAVSEVSELTGAMGAAIAACGTMRGRGQGRRIAAHNLAYDRFTCDGCDNRCAVIRTKDASPRYCGGRCGRWDGEQQDVTPTAPSLLSMRAELMESADQHAQPDEFAGPVVGIPRALMSFDKLPAWRVFFEELGCRVVVSPPTNNGILGEGMRRLVVETCLPVKAFCAHLCWLDDHGDVDYIFVPSAVSEARDDHGTITRHCPYIQSVVQLARPIVKTPLLAPTFSWAWHPRDEERAFCDMARQLGASAADFAQAWRRYVEEDRRVRASLREHGNKVLEDLARGKVTRAFVILGKDYNIYDSMLNAGVVRWLERRGECVITQDMIIDGGSDYPRQYRAMCWSHGKEILAAAHAAARTKGLYPIMISSFGCGPDSFTIRSARELMENTPFLVLDVDEHSASTGIETRLEAHLDSLQDNDAGQRDVAATQASLPSRIERVYLPRFSDHGYGFAAALGALGFEPLLTDLPDDESVRLGSAYATAGECHPFVLMLGDYIKLHREDHDLRNACYFMPESSACRVGQFARQMNFVGQSLGGHLPVLSSISDFAPYLSNSSFTAWFKVLSTYWEMTRGMDFFMQLYLETRAYEAQSGAADRAHARAQSILAEHVTRGKPLEGLEKAVGLLKAVPTDRSQHRVKIGITGDYYTRVCDYANGDIFRDIERLGGVVMLSPTLTEFAKFDAYRKRYEAINHGSVKDLMGSLALRSVVERRERRVRRIFGDSLMYDVPIDYKRAVKKVKPYMDFKLPASLTGSIASIMEQIDAGADGILSLITFHCNYGLVINSVLASLDREYPDMPKLSLIFEGLKPTHNVTRLEAFMERVHAHADAKRGSVSKYRRHRRVVL